MAKVKYRYNPETLSYDVITITIKERLIKWSYMLAASIFITVAYFLAYSYFFETPKERTMSNRIAALKFDYQMLIQELNDIDLMLADIQKRDDNIYRTVLESEPIPASIRQAGFGGVNRYVPLEGFENSNMMISATRHSHRILNQLYIQSLSYDELIEKAIQNEQMTQSRPAILPIARRDIVNTSGFNLFRLHPLLGYRRPHMGMDFSAKIGTPIHATGDGTVVVSEFNRGYGWYVVIDHGIVGYHTLYAHMRSRAVVEIGEEVKRGQVIGHVGSTGLSQAPHVHYEVHKNGYRRQVDPSFYFYFDLSDEEYFQFLEQANNSNEMFEDWNEQIYDEDDY